MRLSTISLGIFSLLVGTASGKKMMKEVDIPSVIASDSQFGKSLMSKARTLENYNAVDMSWIPSFSLHFEQCYDEYVWNEYAEEGTVKMQNQRVVKFKLCPTEYCGLEGASGCSSDSYGEYVVSLHVFLESLMEWLTAQNEQACEKYAYEKCGCYDDDGKDDRFNQYACEYQCWYKNEKHECYYDYANDDDAGNFDLEEFSQCGQYQPNKNQNYYNNYQNMEFYVGPFCGNGGASVKFGLFKDATCTNYYDDNYGQDTFEEISGGDSLPYSSTNLIPQGCVSCARNNYNNNGGDDAQMCYYTYQFAGKCEEMLEDDILYPNNAACKYIYGLERKNGASSQYVKQAVGVFNSHPEPFLIITGAWFFLSLLFVRYLSRKLNTRDEDRKKAEEEAYDLSAFEAARNPTAQLKSAFMSL